MRTLLLLLISLACAAPVVAQNYPSKPIQIIVPFPPGGGTDLLARVMADKLRDKFGQPVTVENRSGAAGNIGADAVYKAPADGHTLLFTQPAPIVVNQAMYAKLSFEPERFVPIALVSIQDIMLAANPKLPAGNLKELISYAKANPGKLNFGSSGAGSAPHLAAELFAKMAGVNMVHVPYKGSGESQSATLAGHVDLTFFAFSTALRHTKAGKLRALAVGGTKRNPQAPDVPSIAEVLPGYSAASWTALFAPPATPAPVVQRLTEAAAEILKMPDVQKRLADQGDDSAEMTPAQLAEFLREERERWGSLIKTLGLQVK
ncbi:MAG TPA: tripartite tricarboxylate transporter substrate binding protein [Burkholderiales bacterium]|nr:tripartite tricarboxylate transporter substrate binding protein [Burkholderiales bacterium]